MNEPLFSQIERTNTDPREDTKPHFAYLDKSARVEMVQIREVLEAWFSQYPDAEKHEFKRRCQTNDSKLASALFELYLHELLLRLGYSVEIQPKERTANLKRPDFFVHAPDGERFYLEATVASGISDEEAIQIYRMNQTYDAINRIHSPNFFIRIDTQGAPKSEPPIKTWSQRISNWLDSLAPDVISKPHEDKEQEALPRLVLSHDGWDMTLHAMPKSINARGKPGVRPIGIRLGGFERMNIGETIRNAVTAKAKRYGKLDAPYIIAVNVCTPVCDRIDIMEALFGTERYLIPAQTDQPDDEPKITLSRSPNGAWTRPSRPRYTRVSAVLLEAAMQEEGRGDSLSSSGF